MSLADEFSDALKARENDLSNTFTWSGASYACSASAYTTTKTWKDDGGGADVMYDLSLTVRVATLAGSVPAEGDTIIHRGATYTLQKIVHDPTGTFRRFICLAQQEGI